MNIESEEYKQSLLKLAQYAKMEEVHEAEKLEHQREILQMKEEMEAKRLEHEAEIEKWRKELELKAV